MDGGYDMRERFRNWGEERRGGKGKGKGKQNMGGGGGDDAWGASIGMG